MPMRTTGRSVFSVTIGLVVASTLATVAVPLGVAGAQRASHTVRPMTFPVDGKVSFRDDFSECREADCSRAHEGNDLIGTRLTPLVAAADGVVDWLVLAGPTTTKSGNALSIKDADGWRYVYVHLNNDTPETDDGLNPPEWRFAPGIAKGVRVTAGQLLGYLGDSGNAELSTPHLHFELRTPANIAISPFQSLKAAQARRDGTAAPALASYAVCNTPSNPAMSAPIKGTWGYRIVMGDGRVLSFGAAKPMTDPKLTGSAKDPVAMAQLPSGKGYWVTTAAGVVTAVGEAPKIPGRSSSANPVVAMVPTPSGKGFWLVSNTGAVSQHGDAPELTSSAASPVVAAVGRPTGAGLWLLSEDGAITAVGDAPALSSAEVAQGAPVSLSATPSGKGLWVLTSTGDILAAGDATDLGSLAGEGLCELPVPVSVQGTSGKGYVIMAADGSVWAYGDARWIGDLPDRAITGKTILGVVVPPSATTTVSAAAASAATTPTK